jgi:spermidine synthase
MIPWVKIDTARIPGSDGELRLMRRGAEFSIKLGTNELMNSRLSGSEAALATLAAKKIEGIKKPHVLIGGLGMGFTLRAALAVLGPAARVKVAELVPAVIAWAKGPMAEIFGDSLSDRRVRIVETDVFETIRAHPNTFDAILLDVDNGPEGLTRKANDALYDSAGLKLAWAAARRARGLVVRTQPTLHEALAPVRLRCQRSRRPRHRARRRLPSRDLDRGEVFVNTRANGRVNLRCRPPRDPVRRGLSDQSMLSPDDWIVRSSPTMTAVLLATPPSPPRRARACRWRR